MSSLRISFPVLPHGGWFTHDVRAASIRRQLDDGTELRGLPLEWSRLDHDLSHAEELLSSHYRWPREDPVDLTLGWDHEESRLAFLASIQYLTHEARRVAGRDWTVEVAPEPGAVSVRLMGEYGCDWPLWVHDGGTGPESWPQLSPGLVDRLHDWAARAEPDRYPPPPEDETARLRRDLQAELGDHFVVT